MITWLCYLISHRKCIPSYIEIYYAEIFATCRNQEDLLDSRRRSSSTGLINFSQSCVPLGTMRSSCSATTIPSTYDRLVLFIVVMKTEPPGCTQKPWKRLVHAIWNCRMRFYWFIKLEKTYFMTFLQVLHR